MAFQYGFAAAEGELSFQAATPLAIAFSSGVSLLTQGLAGGEQDHGDGRSRGAVSLSYSSETSLTSRNPTSTYPFEGSTSRRLEMRRSVGPSIQEPPLTMTVALDPGS